MGVLHKLVGFVRGPAPGSLTEGAVESTVALQRQLVAFLRSLHRMAELCGQCTWDQAEARMLAARGFLLRPGRSTIPHPAAGTGVFLAAGALHSGQVVTLYPGAVYSSQQLAELAAWESPADEALAPTLPAFTAGNHYLLSQLFLGQQQLVVDGRPEGLSARRFAAAAEEAAGRGQLANAAWLSSSSAQGAPGGEAALAPALHCLLRQAALGHLINHPPQGTLPNVAFDLCPLPPGLPPHLLRFVPNLNYEGGSWARPMLGHRRRDHGISKASDGTEWRWVVVLRAVRDVHLVCGGEAELFMDYGRDPLSLGYSP